MSPTDKLREFKYGTSCQLLTVRHTDAPEAVDDAHGSLVALVSYICSPLLNLKKKEVFLLCHRERLKKEKGRRLGGEGGLWGVYPALALSLVALPSQCNAGLPLPL